LSPTVSFFLGINPKSNKRKSTERFKNLRMKKKSIFYFISFFFFFDLQNGWSMNFEKGKDVFHNNCLPCHKGGRNFILPEKNLKKDTLEANGMNTVNAISYQVRNGKNGMPAFGGRLSENEVEDVAFYVLQEASSTFLKKEENFP
jgi:cytochrome c6